MSIKHEEMVPLADMVWDSFKRDQVELESENSTLTEGNHGGFAALSDYISEVCNVGKTVYEGKVKADEYNIKKLLTKLHSAGGGGNTPPPK